MESGEDEINHSADFYWFISFKKGCLNKNVENHKYSFKLVSFTYSF